MHICAACACVKWQNRSHFLYDARYQYMLICIICLIIWQWLPKTKLRQFHFNFIAGLTSKWRIALDIAIKAANGFDAAVVFNGLGLDNAGNEAVDHLLVMWKNNISDCIMLFFFLSRWWYYHNYCTMLISAFHMYTYIIWKPVTLMTNICEEKLTFLIIIMCICMRFSLQSEL